MAKKFFTMKIYNWLLIKLARKVLPGFLKGYRTLILGWVLIADGIYDKIVASGIPDEACGLYAPLCVVTAFIHTGGAKVILGLLIQILRADSDTQIPIPKDKSLDSESYL